MSKYLITGGAGFIGSALAEKLVGMGHDVRILDDLSSGKLANLQSIIKQVEFIRGDVRDLELSMKACKGMDFVLHHAAIASVQASITDPGKTCEVGILGTSNILTAAKDSGVSRVIFASSASVYGNTSSIPIREDQPLDPISPYAASKLAGEFYCRVFKETFGLETVVLRYFNVFGPRQDPASPYAGVISKFIDALTKGNAPTVFGDGEQTRDFISVDDVVKANIAAASAKAADVSGQVFNIASGKRLSVNEMLRAANGLLGTNIVPKHEKAKAGDIKHSQADISKAEKMLKFKPKVSFRDGLESTISWYLQ